MSIIPRRVSILCSWFKCWVCIIFC